MKYERWRRAGIFGVDWASVPAQSSDWLRMHLHNDGWVLLLVLVPNHDRLLAGTWQ